MLCLNENVPGPTGLGTFLFTLSSCPNLWLEQGIQLQVLIFVPDKIETGIGKGRIFYRIKYESTPPVDYFYPVVLF